MQLFLLIALLFASGKGGECFYSEVKPLLESFGGEEVKRALKSAEEFKGVLNAFGGMGGSQSGVSQNKSACDGCGEYDGTYGSTNQSQCKNTKTSAERGKDENCNPVPPFAMAPVARLADREIIYRLAQYFSEGASA